MLSGLRLREHKQLRDAFRWHLVGDSKDARHHQDARNRREIARWIEGGTRLKRRVDSHCAVGPPRERAAVGGRFCHSLGPHTPPAPGMFSTVTGVFHASLSFCANRRAVLSVALPAVTPTLLPTRP